MHLCIDMQRLFAEATAWETPWLRRILPNVETLVALDPARTVFTRFVPPETPRSATGTWARYYERWPMMTREALDPAMIDLVPSLARHAPPARVLDKPVYSPWLGTPLDGALRHAGIDTLIISGAETEICVLAAVVGAIDLGYRVILPVDALCSSADSTHDAMLAIYESRFGTQVETVKTFDLVAAMAR